VVPFIISEYGPVPEVEVNVSCAIVPEQTGFPVIDPWGSGFTVMPTVLAVLGPHVLTAVTDKVPDVAVAEKSSVTELVVPFIVTPVPL
jgi:hypothetical protein